MRWRRRNPSICPLCHWFEPGHDPGCPNWQPLTYVPGAPRRAPALAPAARPAPLPVAPLPSAPAAHLPSLAEFVARCAAWRAAWVMAEGRRERVAIGWPKSEPRASEAVWFEPVPDDDPNILDTPEFTDPFLHTLYEQGGKEVTVDNVAVTSGATYRHGTAVTFHVVGAENPKSFDDYVTLTATLLREFYYKRYHPQGFTTFDPLIEHVRSHNLLLHEHARGVVFTLTRA